MLRKVTLSCVGPLWARYLKIHRWCEVVGPMLAQQYFTYTLINQCWANVSTPTMTCCQLLQPLPNVGPTIACYFGRDNQSNFKFYQYTCLKSPKMLQL